MFEPAAREILERVNERRRDLNELASTSGEAGDRKAAAQVFAIQQMLLGVLSDHGISTVDPAAVDPAAGEAAA